MTTGDMGAQAAGAWSTETAALPPMTALTHEPTGSLVLMNTIPLPFMANGEQHKPILLLCPKQSALTI